MKRFMRIVGLVALMVSLVLASSGCTSSLLAKAAQATGIEALHAGVETSHATSLRREVQLLNLLNGLELSEGQMRFVLAKAQEADSIREELRTKGQENADEVVRVLTEFRDALMRGENVSEDLRREWHSLYSENHALLEQYQREMDRLASEIQGQLEEHQLYALEQFVPCIVPPEGELRIGQAGGTAGLENALARVREIPEKKYELWKEILAQRALEQLKGHLPPGYALDEDEAREAVLSIVEEARALSDVEFEVQRGELAQRLRSELTPPKTPVCVEVMIQRHLLDPHIIPLLGEKLG